MGRNGLLKVQLWKETQPCWFQSHLATWKRLTIMLKGKGRIQCELVICVLWLCLSKMFIFSEAFKGSTKKWKCIRGMKLKILSLCSLIDQINNKDSIWPTKTPIHVELHCFPNKLLAIEFLSQVSEGSQTNVGLFLGLGCLGRRAWTAFWFFLRTQCPI